VVSQTVTASATTTMLTSQTPYGQQMVGPNMSVSSNMSMKLPNRQAGTEHSVWKAATDSPALSTNAVARMAMSGLFASRSSIDPAVAQNVKALDPMALDRLFNRI
jgi:hypothetical protein